MGIQDRKEEHVRITTEQQVGYDRSTGLDKYEFKHNALPEANFEEVRTEQEFMGRTFSLPLFISSMTGGYVDAGKVNAIIASFCEEYNLPFGVGSQRILLENENTANTFEVVREEAPTAFIAANIGGTQVADGLQPQQISTLVDSIEADAIIVHLNPLQELLQPEGDRNFRGIRDGIRQLTKDSPVPVIVKETGAGIDGKVAERLIQCGVSAIDVAGAGGTSWAKVENRRTSQDDPAYEFDNWGLPTDRCLQEINEIENRNKIDLIGSGGVRNSFDIAKVICLGADFAAMASPIIRAVSEGGREGLVHFYNQLERHLKIILTLTGCESVKQLSTDILYEL